MSDPRSTLEDIFEAERALRRSEQKLLDADASHATGLEGLLGEAVRAALAEGDDPDAAMRLERLADLCAQVPGPGMIDALISILDAEAESARIEAYEALQDVGYERYAEVARGVERALESGERGQAMRELPFILAEIAEPSARPLIVRFLKIDDVEVQAAAVEALVTLGDPEAAAALKPLIEDPRPVEVDGDTGDETATLGELVAEAIEALEGA
ncbi:MAG: HEAT repeat domain-containing protein [Myxococcales bacterium]|jgi:HEAT repeat protein